MKTDIENRKFPPSAVSLLIVIVAGWICPGLNGMDATPVSESTAPAELTITDFKATHPTSSVAGAAGGLIGGLIAAGIEKHRELTPYEEALSRKCLAAMEGVFISGKGIVYVPRSSLGISDLNSGSTKGRAIKVELLFGMKMGWKKRLNATAQWQIVSPEGRVEKKLRTSATADKAAAVFPDTKDPRYEATLVELAKRNAAQFLQIIRDPSAPTAAAATADETSIEADESIGYFNAITSDPLPLAGLQYYTRNCFKYEKGVFITTNYWVGTLVPINTQVTLVKLDEKNMELRLPGGETVTVKNVEKYSKRSLGTIAHNLLTPQPVPLEKYDPATASAIKSGTLTAGMNKEQVVMTRGYPPGHRTPSLDGETWMYWNTRSGTQSIVFKNGVLSGGEDIPAAESAPKPDTAVAPAETKAPEAVVAASPGRDQTTEHGTSPSSPVTGFVIPGKDFSAQCDQLGGDSDVVTDVDVLSVDGRSSRGSSRSGGGIKGRMSQISEKTQNLSAGGFHLRARSIGIIDGIMEIWDDHAKHTWIGTLSYAGYTFESSASDPLQFQVEKNRGYVYLKGTGRVRTPDQKVIDLPPATPDDRIPGTGAEARKTGVDQQQIGPFRVGIKEVVNKGYKTVGRGGAGPSLNPTASTIRAGGNSWETGVINGWGISLEFSGGSPTGKLVIPLSRMVAIDENGASHALSKEKILGVCKGTFLAKTNSVTTDMDKQDGQFALVEIWNDNAKPVFKHRIASASETYEVYGDSKDRPDVTIKDPFSGDIEIEAVGGHTFNLTLVYENGSVAPTELIWPGAASFRLAKNSAERPANLPKAPSAESPAAKP
jgi:hypothetical protein